MMGPLPSLVLVRRLSGEEIIVVGGGKIPTRNEEMRSWQNFVAIIHFICVHDRTWQNI
jgi:hypothetical protein